VGRDRLRYYVIKKGRGYWQPTPAMKAVGFRMVRCGPDGPQARAIAIDWSARWDAHRRGEAAGADAARVQPGSLAEAFARYRTTGQWNQRKAESTRKEWLAAWKRIEPVFGEMRPGEVTMELIDAWRGALVEIETPDTVWRCLKIWRAMWRVAAANGYCVQGADPSFALTRGQAARRTQRWREGEVVRLVKTAWRAGHKGLSCIIAVTWDTQFAPGDVRRLTPAHRLDECTFTIRRGKTDAEAIGTISRRTLRLIASYLEQLGVEIAPDAELFRTTEGSRYMDKTALSTAFARLRSRAFGDEETRTLMDMRRSGAVEALVGEVDPGHLGAKMANTIADARDLQRTYQPVDLAAVRAADEARLRGRRKLRMGGKSAAEGSGIRTGNRVNES
jgi:hypothetical protein